MASHDGCWDMTKETNQVSFPSSHDFLAGAEWDCQQPGSYKELAPTQAQGKRYS
jgi:hypothetical protein